MKGNKIAVVIPAFNEQAALPHLLDELLQRPRRLAAIIVVDDGSTDATPEAATRPGVTLVRHHSNHGKARALIDGMLTALQQGARYVVTLDADGQHRPQDLDSLLELSASNPEDVIIGARLHDKRSIPVARYRANRFANFWIGWAAGQPVSDSQSGFRVYPANLLQQVLPKLSARYPAGPRSRRKGFVLDSELLIEAGHHGVRLLSVGIPAIYRTERTSHFRPIADFAAIGRMVASQLIGHGLNPGGLVRSLRPAMVAPLTRSKVPARV